MQAAPDSNSHDLESDSSKIRYDQDLYQMMARKFQQWMGFLESYGRQMPSNLVDSIDTSSALEECMLINLNLMLQLAVKLRVPLGPVKAVVRMLILQFTPLDPSIRRTYAAQGLILTHDRTF